MLTFIQICAVAVILIGTSYLGCTLALVTTRGKEAP